MNVYWVRSGVKRRRSHCKGVLTAEIALTCTNEKPVLLNGHNRKLMAVGKGELPFVTVLFCH